jgi:hypothetical protein
MKASGDHERHPAKAKAPEGNDMFKKHLEFFTMDLSSGWEVPEE